MTLPQLVGLVRDSLYDHGTKVLLLDDITRLRMYREADQDALDLIRSLMSMHLTLVLIGVGIRDSGVLREGAGRFSRRSREAATQTERRFDLVDLDPFRYDTADGIAAWVAHLAGIEDRLRLFHARSGMLTTGTMPEYLFRRTNGIVGLLERLIEDGCGHAMDTGTEDLTTDVLDDIDINLGNMDGRMDGETPDIPPRATPTTGRRKRRSRNTVFDDKGAAERRASG
jgi:hypothetical protein